MYTELKRKIVKCRVAHMCSWCAEKINVGAPAQYRSYVYDGDFNHDWMHPECEKACAEVALEEKSFEFMPGDFPRGSTEGY